EVQIRDLAQRVIYALAASADRIDLPLPFTIAGEGDEIEKQPQELFMIVRTLMSTLSGTTFRGKLTIGEGVEAFLFDRNGEGLLAMWDKGNRPGSKQLALNLGEHPRAVDLWGNVTPLLRTSADKGNQKVQVDRLNADFSGGYRWIAGPIAGIGRSGSPDDRVEFCSAWPADSLHESISPDDQRRPEAQGACGMDDQLGHVQFQRESK